MLTASRSSERQYAAEKCTIGGCGQEAVYWIDTTEGFVERLLTTATAPDTFYLCRDHYNEVANDDGEYVHLRIDTGELIHFETGVLLMLGGVHRVQSITYDHPQSSN